MSKLLLPVLVVLLVLPGLLGCGEDDQPTRPNDFIPLSSIEIVSQNPAIANLTSNQFTASGNFSGFFTRNITAEVLWASSDPAVATISTIGRATAVSPGTTTITATLDGISTSFELAVSDAVITVLDITPLLPSTPRGLTTQFSAVGTFSDATSQDLTFDADWASSAPAVATIGNAPGDKGLARALTEGPTTISAAFGGVTQSTVMTVTAPALASIAIEPANASQLSLTRRGYIARGTFSDGTSRDVSSEVTWTSSSPSVAEIEATSGRLTALAQGNVSISAALGGVSATTGLTVTGGNLTSIQISPLNPTLVHPTSTLAGAVGTTRRMTALGNFSNGTQRDITEMVTWEILPTGFAQVGNTGGNEGVVGTLAPTVTPPTVTLSAKFGTLLTASTSLSVLSGTLSSLQVTPIASNIAVGTSTRFQVTGSFIGAPTQDLTRDAAWSSSAPLVASVDTSDFKEGRLRGQQAGTALITASFGGLISNNATLTVTSRALQNLSIAPVNPTTGIGGSLQFTATAGYFDGSSQIVTEDVTLSLDNTNVAIFPNASRNPGLVYGVNLGTATLSAQLGAEPAQTRIINVNQ
ncbi:MAG TPA: Ig-like domain-containing protein [Desulfuromonadales bacterium]|nr:Ig-like domain-containing protein [Desulfuromonadales bacterium]